MRARQVPVKESMCSIIHRLVRSVEAALYRRRWHTGLVIDKLLFKATRTDSGVSSGRREITDSIINNTCSGVA